MKHFLIFIGALLLLISCKKDDSLSSLPRRTVLVYMSGENNLSPYADADIREMIEGRKSVADNENLIIYVDHALQNEKPFIARITKDQNHPVDTLYRFSEDHYSSDPQKLQQVLQWVVNNCPASEDYGLVFWGHANGWIIEDETIPTSSAPRRAYGVDNGRNASSGSLVLKGPWLNIPTLRQVLENVNKKWKFIFFDCCNMQCAEVAYELRNLCYYMIASPAEITGVGAPYEKIVPDMFIHDVKTMCESIVNDYHAQRTNRYGTVTVDGECQLPLCAIRSNKMQALADATRAIMPQVATYIAQEGATDGLTFYYNYGKEQGFEVVFPEEEDVLYDMNMVIKRALSEETSAYNTWKTAFDAAIYHVQPFMLWHSNCIHFERFADANIEEQGCMSMFFPLSKYSNVSHTYTQDIQQMQWYQAVGASSVGW